MEQYAIYLRKSRADLELEKYGEMETLARHEKTLTELAEKKKFYIAEIYKEVVSGETISARPEVQKLLTDVEGGQYSGVIVMEIERLARGDTIDQGIIAKTFKESSTKIITPSKIYDPDNEFDEEYFEFGLFMSRREYKTINRRIQRGRIASAKEGKAIMSTPPYGYDKVKIKNEKGFTLKPNKEAKIVKLIYSLYNNGDGANAIAKKLDEMKVRPRKDDKWSKSTITDILKNPVYMGMVRWGYEKEKKKITHGTERTTREKRDEYIYVIGLHPTIITKETFEKAQKRRKQNTHKCTTPGNELKNPLAGLIYCQKCGSLMSRLGCNRKNKYDSIICPNRDCDNVSAPLFLLENAIIKALEEWIGKLEITAQHKKDDISGEAEKAICEELQKTLATTQKQLSQTYDFLELGLYSPDIFKQRNSELQIRKSETEQAIIKIREEEKNRNCAISLIPQVKNFFDIYYKIPTAEGKNASLKILLKRAEYIKEKANKKGSGTSENFKVKIYPIIKADYI